MKNLDNYSEKLNKAIEQSLFLELNEADQKSIKEFAMHYKITFQEFKILVDDQVDARQWQETPPTDLINFKLDKNQQMKIINEHMRSLKNQLKTYKEGFDSKFSRNANGYSNIHNPENKIFGQCPVASSKTVCCNLYTIDAVKNCGFSCSYCSIQTMYKGEKILFDEQFDEKVTSLQSSLKQNTFYHIGSGQSSDALMWGNRNGILDSLMRLPKENKNILLELKTKSNNIEYFLNHSVPSNVILSWSLNPQTIIDHEEHQTANLNDRLSAARKVADKGIKVSFHFHPIIPFDSWKSEYENLFSMLKKMFKPEEIGFISFGTLTFPKPVLKKIRQYEYATKILQMEMVPNPEGKLTYPVELKKEIFNFSYQSFSEWHGKVFFYLCMEESQFWHSTFGRCYDTNELFEADMAKNVMSKIWGNNVY